MYSSSSSRAGAAEFDLGDLPFVRGRLDWLVESAPDFTNASTTWEKIRMTRVPGRTRASALCAVLAVLIVLIGCKTIPVTARPPISVPQGLTEAKVESTIMQSVFGVQPKASARADSYGAPSSAQPEFVRVRRSEWAFEGREPGVITASVSPRSHYLRVDIVYDAHTVEVVIVDADNMKYSGSRIHGKAIQWIGNLEKIIRSGLSLAAMSRD
jgi:hypothetical protein